MRNTKIRELFASFPGSEDFFEVNSLHPRDGNLTVAQYIESLPYAFVTDMGIDHEALLERFDLFMEQLVDLRRGVSFDARVLTILGGEDKHGAPEVDEIEIRQGEVVCVVGPTGSGKSRLLADIEWMAQGDTPTKRRILINGREPPEEWRFSLDKRLVAQLSQNMNFVMDITVVDFLKLHAASRNRERGDRLAEKVIQRANELSGEPFDPAAPLTALSGGQSRALMVADIAYLSFSPIVLIDEIENAGIDRERALDLLIQNQKIVLIVTHDPLLALRSDRRMVIRDGGISGIIETTAEEKACLSELYRMDRVLMNYRERLRNGKTLAAKEDSEG